MREIRELLRLKYELVRSHREIAGSIGVGNGTVSDYVRRVAVPGLSWFTAGGAGRRRAGRGVVLGPAAGAGGPAGAGMEGRAPGAPPASKGRHATAAVAGVPAGASERTTKAKVEAAIQHVERWVMARPYHILVHRAVHSVPHIAARREVHVRITAQTGEPLPRQPSRPRAPLESVIGNGRNR